MIGPRRRTLALTVAVFGLWMLVLAGGLAWAHGYSAEPGEPARAAAAWPRRSRLARAVGGRQLLLFAHPECPCTRATISELERLMAQAPGLDATVVFSSASGSDPRNSSIWKTAARVRGLTLIADEGAEEAQRFGAATSGQVLLFAGDGSVLFRGGITAARGHEGEAPGQEAILRHLQGLPAPDTAAVFGCSLF